MNLKNAFFLALALFFLSNCGGTDNSDTDSSDSLRQVNTNAQAIEDNLMNDIHSYARPKEARMKHLNLELEVDFDQKILKGVARIHIENTASAQQLFLDSKALLIEKVSLGTEESETDFKLAPPFEHLGTQISINIKPDTKIVNVYYQTDPKAEALQWLSPAQTSGKKDPFLFTQSQAILARSWVPCQDSPGIRFSYEAQVKVPKNLLALMSAENPLEKNETGIYNFKMPQAIPAYLLALSVGDLAFAQISDKVGVYAEPEVLKSARYEFEEVPKMLEAAEELYGDYRWGRYDLLVLPPSFPFGGMENPRLTFATPTILAGDRSLTSLVAHELAHSWSGNLVTNATWGDFWLNEGFTVYFERRIMEAISGADYAEMLAYLGYQDLKSTLDEFKALGIEKETHLKLDLQGRNPDDGVTNVAYEKGYFLLKEIENEVGRAKMDTFLKAYFDTFAFKSMTTKGFTNYINEKLPQLSLNLDDWIYSPGLPTSFEAPTSSRFEAVNETLKKWESGTPAQSLSTDTWTSHEWLYFIRQLPDSISLAQIEDLDQSFQFSQSGNSEILAAWFIPTIQAGYTKIEDPLEKFLMRVGRRKFLMPIYKTLLETKGGKEKARNIYTRARENYHYVSSNSLDPLILGQEK